MLSTKRDQFSLTVEDCRSSEKFTGLEDSDLVDDEFDVFEDLIVVEHRWIDPMECPFVAFADDIGRRVARRDEQHEVLAVVVGDVDDASEGDVELQTCLFEDLSPSVGKDAFALFDMTADPIVPTDSFAFLIRVLDEEYLPGVEDEASGTGNDGVTSSRHYCSRDDKTSPHVFALS